MRQRLNTRTYHAITSDSDSCSRMPSVWYGTSCARACEIVSLHVDRFELKKKDARERQPCHDNISSSTQCNITYQDHKGITHADHQALSCFMRGLHCSTGHSGTTKFAKRRAARKETPTLHTDSTYRI
jgi:hypothetical protein